MTWRKPSGYSRPGVFRRHARKRKVDRALLADVAKLPCMACGKNPGGEAHHVTTRGAGGDDVAENLMPLCHEHHMAVHKMGYRAAMEKWPGIRTWLEGAGRSDILVRSEK